MRSLAIRTNNAPPLHGTRQERTFKSSGRLRFVRLHTFGDRDPGLFAAGPNMTVRLQAARIVQRSGLN